MFQRFLAINFALCSFFPLFSMDIQKLTRENKLNNSIFSWKIEPGSGPLSYQVTDTQPLQQQNKTTANKETQAIRHRKKKQNQRKTNVHQKTNERVIFRAIIGTDLFVTKKLNNLLKEKLDDQMRRDTANKVSVAFTLACLEQLALTPQKNPKN